MEVNTASQASEAPMQPGSRPDAVRMMVINNSQIISCVLRATSVVTFLAAALGLSLKLIPSGQFREIGKIFDIGLIAVAAGLFILNHFLERALRRCPICQTRITSATEEKRRCLECDTELWGYWDE